MSSLVPKVLAYFYPGWEDSRSFDEWEIVASGKPSFTGHWQPRIPRMRYYLDDPGVMELQIRRAITYGVDGFVFCWYWDKGTIHLPLGLKRLLEVVERFPGFAFGLMWANRVPHISLPISAEDIDGDFYRAFSERTVRTDAQDISRMVNHCRDLYFDIPNYFRIDGRPFFSVFSMRDVFSCIGPPEQLPSGTFKTLFGEDVHFVGVSHGWEHWLENAADLGIDALSSYVLLPDWHGPPMQRYEICANRAYLQWITMARLACLPVIPSATVGWDASCRGKELIRDGKKTYPWAPIVVDGTPEHFERHLFRALDYAVERRLPAVLIASWNEWSEGHYLEPDVRYGTKWLEAVRRAKSAIRRELE